MERILQVISERFIFQFSVRNSHMPQEEYLEAVELYAPGGVDEYQTIRESYNAVLWDNCVIGHNNFNRTVYLTIFTHVVSPEEAFVIFEESDSMIRDLFAGLYGFPAESMTLTDRFRLLYDIYHPEADTPEFGSRVDYDGSGFSIDSMLRMRETTKEVVAPDNYECRERDYLKAGSKFVRMFFINSIPASVPDSILNHRRVHSPLLASLQTFP